MEPPSHNKTPSTRCFRSFSDNRLNRIPGIRRLFFCFLAIAALLSAAPLAFAQPDDAKRLVSLLDYLGSDYKNAVKDGKILSADEYTEMQEFSKRSQELFNQLKQADKADRAGIESTIKSLAAQIDKKAEPQIVAELAQNAKEKLITAYKIVPYPKQLPSLDSGQKLYVENCAQCHGESGKGDGPGRSSMNPKTPPPANFTDPERMAGLSPFKAFNTASFGVEGTAMASFAALSEEQRWQVAFYVMSLRFSREQADRGAALIQQKKLPAELTAVANLATDSDEQLSEQLKSYFDQEDQVNDVLAYLRRGLLEQKPADPLVLTRNLVRESAALYAAGEKEKAYQKAVDAYIDGYELAEPALFAKDASFGRSLEGLFTAYRNAIKQGVGPEEIDKRRSEIEAGLDRASEIIARNDDYSGIYFFLNSALIIVREGLEATLVLAAILTMLKVMGATHAVRYIHHGLDPRAHRRRPHLGCHSNVFDLQRTTSRKHGRLHLGFCRRSFVLRRLLAAHEVRSQEVAELHSRQGTKRGRRQEDSRTGGNFIFCRLSRGLRSRVVLPSAMAAERKRPSSDSLGIHRRTGGSCRADLRHFKARPQSSVEILLRRHRNLPLYHCVHFRR